MSRSPSIIRTLSGRFLTGRILSVAFGAALCASITPAFSQVPVSNANFSITFPDNWLNFSGAPKPDSSGIMLFNMNTEAITYLFAAAHAGELTAAEISAAIKGFGASDSLEVTAEGTKTLGGKSFSFIEWKKAGATGDDAEQRYRVYLHTTGTFMFEGILGYSAGNAVADVGDMETALATLILKGGATSLRAAAMALRPAPLRPDRDVLGRQARLLSGKRLPVALFRGN